MARARGARTESLAAFESTYGTAPGSGFFRMPFAQNRLGGSQELLESELLGYGRDPLPPTKDALNARGDLSIPVDAQSVGFWLKAAFGGPTTTGSGPYTHDYNSGGWTLPSFSIEKGMPDIPLYEMYSGCMLDRITIPMQRSGQFRATVDVIAQGVDDSPTSQAGTPTDYTLQRFGHFNGSILRDDVALGNIVSGEIVYQNNLDPVEVIRSDGRIDGIDPSMAMLTGRLVARFADTTLLNQATAGTPSKLDFDWEIDANTKLTITAHAVYLPRPSTPIEGPQGVQVTFDWQAAQGGVDSRLCDVALINDVSAY